MKRTETITHNWIQSRSRWTPYDGVQVKGWPVGTFVRGRCVAWNGEILGPADGEPVRFLGEVWTCSLTAAARPRLLAAGAHARQWRQRARNLRRQPLHDRHRAADLHAVGKVDDVAVQHPETSRGCRLADGLGIVGAVNAIQRVAEIDRLGARADS